MDTRTEFLGQLPARSTLRGGIPGARRAGTPGSGRLLGFAVAAWLALAGVARTAPAQETLPAPADTSAPRAVPPVAVLCEALVVLDYQDQQDRMMLGETDRAARRIVGATVRGLRRGGRDVSVAAHVSSGIDLDPEQEYRLAWERPSKERGGAPPFAHPPFHAEPRFAAGESTLVLWRALVERVSRHDAEPSPEATWLARELGAGEVFVIVARGWRRSAREVLKQQGNPFARMVGDELVNDANTRIDLALYDGESGERRWAFTEDLSGWNANSTKRLAEWTDAAVQTMPPRGERGLHGDITSPGFRAPFRFEMALRLGGTRIAREDVAGVMGVSGAYLFRPWLSAGFALDWQAIRAGSYTLGGTWSPSGVESAYRRELHDVELDFFPLYPVVEVHLPRTHGVQLSAGFSGGYALAFLESPDYELQILGDWGWATHAAASWRLGGGVFGLGLEVSYQQARPGRDSRDPITLVPIRERVNLDGWGLMLSLGLWE